MKKLYKLFLTIIAFFIFNLEIVNAIDKFPDKIYIKTSSLMGKYGFHLYKKSYSTTLSGDIVGKAFCTSFWNPAPGECSNSRQECKKIKWYNNDSTKNTKASVGVGAIINSARNSGGSMSWDNYFYTELAINRYLYKNGYGGSANNFSAPQAIENKIKSYVKLAQEIDAKYNEDSVVVDNLKINKTSGNGKNLVELNSDANKYTLTAKMACKDNNGKQIACSTVKTDLTVTINNSDKKLTNVKVKKNNDKTVTLSADVSNMIINNVGKEISFKITGYNNVKYYQAQRYSCGSSCYTTAQTMSPNLLKTIETSKSDWEFGVFKTPAVVEETCVDKLSKIINNKNIDSQTQYENKLVALYEEELAKNNDFGELLNVDSPSCSAISNDFNISCGNSTITKKYIDEKEVNGKRYKAYCQLTYSFDSNVLKNSSGNVNDLIYKSDDGIIGQANFVYDCSLLGKSLSSYGEVNDNLGNLEGFIPNVSMNVFEKNVDFDYNIDISDGKYCKIDTNGDINCGNYVNNGSGWLINLNINYYYSDDYKWSIGKGNLTNTQQSYLVRSNNCSNNCLEYSYGIHIPSDTTPNDDENEMYFSKFKIDLSGTKFEGAFNDDNKTVSSDTSSCSYAVTNEKIKSEVLYRGIDTSKPFLGYDGENRYVGSNWCGTEMVDEDLPYNADTVIYENKNEQCRKRYLGDVNNNNEWDSEDAELIQQASLNLINLNEDDKMYADVNQDGRISSMDVSNVQKFIYQYNTTELGDINFDGIIDETDVALVQLNWIKYVKLSQVQLKLGDLNHDCRTDINDATLIQKIIVGRASPISEPTINDDSLEGEISAQENALSRNETDFYCSPNNITVKNYITDRPNSDGLQTTTSDDTKTTKTVEPIYSFTLTPSTIKKIREYNDSNSYNDFNLTCTNGVNCVSNFITNLVNGDYGTVNASGKCTNRNTGEFCSVIEEVS